MNQVTGFWKYREILTKIRMASIDYNGFWSFVYSKKPPCWWRQANETWIRLFPTRQVVKKPVLAALATYSFLTRLVKHISTLREEALTMFPSNEYEYEYVPFLYNATWILDNCLIQHGALVVENKIEIRPFLYNAAVIPGHSLTKWNLVILFVHSCTMRLLFLDI